MSGLHLPIRVGVYSLQKKQRGGASVCMSGSTRRRHEDSVYVTVCTANLNISLFQAKQTADTSANTREMKDFFFFFPPSAADRLHYGLLIFNSRTVYVQQSKGWLWFNRCKVRLSCVLFKIDFKRWQTQNAKKKKVLLPAHFLFAPRAENNALFSWADGTDLMYLGSHLVGDNELARQFHRSVCTNSPALLF